VQQAARDISKMTDININEEDLQNLKSKLSLQNKETE
jgi:hypothetical protein